MSNHVKVLIFLVVLGGLVGYKRKLLGCLLILEVMVLMLLFLIGVGGWGTHLVVIVLLVGVAEAVVGLGILVSVSRSCQGRLLVYAFFVGRGGDYVFIT